MFQDEDEIFAEDLQLAQDRSRRHKNKKNKNGKKSGNSTDSRNKSGLLITHHNHLQPAELTISREF